MRYFGKVGFKMTVDKGKGIWETIIKENPYKGDVLRNTTRNQQGESINDNITFNINISIVADPFAYTHFNSIIYCVWRGVKLKVNSIEEQYPRLILSLGGEYNDDQEET